MLIRDKKFFLFLLIFFVLFSCKNKKTEQNNEKGQTRLFNVFSLKQITKSTYNSVYEQANDSVKEWVNHNLKGYEYIKINTWRIDSLICFNQKADRCIMALCKQSTFYKDQDADGITFLYGAKIMNKWYFFSGAFIVTPREMYQKDTHIPLSFSKLHEIAMKEVFNGYLIEGKTKKDLSWWKNTFSPEYEYKYELNDHFFDELNTPLVAFPERKTNPNCPFSCRVIDNEKEYAECLLKKQALSIWNEECAFIKNDTYLYAPELPMGEKVISKINKGESFKVLEYIDNTEWVYVRMSAHNPNLGLIHRKEISKSKI